MGLDMNQPRTALKHRDLIYDIGLHKGEDSLFYLLKGFRVVAVEADPDLVGHCQDRLAEFVRHGRLTIIHGAVVDRGVAAAQGTVAFFKNDENSVWGTACEDWAQRNARRGSASRRIEVDAIDLVDVIEEYGVPHYMKVDIEGADLFCLEALEHFRDRPDYVSIESDRGGYCNILREIELLTSLGYDGFQAIEQARIPRRQLPPRPAREGKYVDHAFEPGASGLFGAELPDRWRTREQILRQYRAITAGYYLLDPDGLTREWNFAGVAPLRTAVRRAVSALLGVPVPSWYDTHARHRSARQTG